MNSNIIYKAPYVRKDWCSVCSGGRIKSDDICPNCMGFGFTVNYDYLVCDTELTEYLKKKYNISDEDIDNMNKCAEYS